MDLITLAAALKKAKAYTDVKAQQFVMGNINLKSLAPEYSPAKTYHIDDYCTRGEKFYRCAVDTSMEQWNAGHWIETTISDEIKMILDMIIEDPDEASKHTITVTCVTQDNATVLGQTVVIRNGSTYDSPVMYTKTYNGSPVEFKLSDGMDFYVSVSNGLAGHFAPDGKSETADDDKDIVLVYGDPEHITTYSAIEECVDSAGKLLEGIEIEDTWVDENGVEYDDPMICVSVETVKDANGGSHTAALMSRKYACHHAIQYSAPQQVEATETTAQAGITYYGLNGSTVSAANLTKLSIAVGSALPYSSYTKIFKHSVNDPTKNIIVNGYNDYGDSGHRQYLNSDADVGEWFEEKNVGDVAPAQLATTRGYMAGCSAALLAAAKPIKVYTKKNTITGNGAIEETIDTFFIPSISQMYGVGDEAEGTAFDYWKTVTDLDSPSNAANNGRKIFDVDNNATAKICRLRTAISNLSYGAHYVDTTGAITNSAGNAYKCTPTCAIYK